MMKRGTREIADKAEERARYENCAKSLLESGHSLPESLRTVGAGCMERELRRAYLEYEAQLRNLCGPGTRILDLFCGDGLHSLTGAFAGGEVWGLDISEASLVLASERARIHQTSLHTVHGDAEAIPLESASFDVVSCAGGFAYADPELLVCETLRVLKPSGVFLMVDVFDCNPIYRLNRFLHYVRGERSWTSIRRTPCNRTLKFLRRHFRTVQVEYYGIFVFSVPLLRLLFARERVARIVDSLDSLFYFLRRYAFRIVVVAKR